MQTVNFIHMEDGTREDYALLERLEAEYNAELPARILDGLRRLENSFSGYQVDRLVQLWRSVHAEDHRATERLQAGRASSATADGGVLSPHWETSIVNGYERRGLGK